MPGNTIPGAEQEVHERGGMDDIPMDDIDSLRRKRIMVFENIKRMVV